MRVSSDAAGGRSAEEGETAKRDRLRAEDLVDVALRDDESRRNEQEDGRDEDDRRNQHRKQNRGGDQYDDDAAVHSVYRGKDN
jgi:hypothetical protein